MRSSKGQLATCEDRPGTADACGEALFDTLFYRTPALDHAGGDERFGHRLLGDTLTHGPYHPLGSRC